MITYQNSLEEIGENNLSGFFVGWQNIPTPATLLKVLKNSDYIFIAVNENKEVVGFITAITDNVLASYIPFIEVLPEYQSKGIGSELVKKMLYELKSFYMIDLLCDENIQNFYEKFDMKKAAGMMVRNFNNQLGPENSKEES